MGVILDFLFGICQLSLVSFIDYGLRQMWRWIWWIWKYTWCNDWERTSSSVSTWWTTYLVSELIRIICIHYNYWYFVNSFMLVLSRYFLFIFFIITLLSLWFLINFLNYGFEHLWHWCFLWFVYFRSFFIRMHIYLWEEVAIANIFVFCIIFLTLTG